MKRFAASVFLLTCAAPAFAQDVDSDGDGLSDWQEIQKYFTDPNKADTDGDGVPDGDWNERREFAYSVRAVIDVLPPIDPESIANDDYQDVRIIKQEKGCVRLEVVLYPFNTNAAAIAETRDWKTTDAKLAKYVNSNVTSNWDAAMQRKLLEQLAHDRIDVTKLTDVEVARQVSAWLLKRAQFEDSFTTFDVEFDHGKARVVLELKDEVDQTLKKFGRTLDEQWDRELFGKGMFENKIHGSCTSTAIYEQTVLRAVGLPTRTIVCIPLVDASDASEVKMIDGLAHNGLRAMLQGTTAAQKNSWTSHTFNEVFVGGRWRRLNYQQLGQNIIADTIGLMVHVNTFVDYADAGLSTWGVRAHRSPKDDPFGGTNPYSCVELADQFGVHAHIDNPPADAVLSRLTVSRVYWWDDPAKDPIVDMRLDEVARTGHLVMHVDETPPFDAMKQFERCYDKIAKGFVLRAPGHDDVHAIATRGFWVNSDRDLREFYLQIPSDQFMHMEFGVAYSLIALDAGEVRFVVKNGVTVTRAHK